jgi:hypothetical protein
MGVQLKAELHDLRQRDVEAYYRALREIAQKMGVTSPTRLLGPEYNGSVVRAAARAGWLDGVDEDGVGDMLPARVTELAAEIGDLVEKAYEVPKA